MSTYPIDTIAVGTVKGVRNVRVMRGEGIFSNNWYTNRPVAGSATTFPDSCVTDIRPLVVIDPEDESAMERIVKAFVAAGCWQVIPADARDSHAHRRAQVQAALREFANPTPPKPEEPTGLGAVVEDAQGKRWVRASTFTTVNHWRSADDDLQGRRRYDEIDAVTVLSEGVQ